MRLAWLPILASDHGKPVIGDPLQRYSKCGKKASRSEMAQLDWGLTVQSLVKLGVTVKVCKKKKKAGWAADCNKLSVGQGRNEIVSVLGDFVAVNTSSNSYDAK
jgi:hypothetical protein